MERVWRTLLVTDLVDSTQLVACLGDLAAAELLARHDGDVRRAVVAAGGREIDRTDGFLLAFEGPVAAARCAASIHRDARTLGLQLRAGLHHAEVVLRANPAEHVALGAKPLELEGVAKPITARVMALARGGQTLCTPAAREGLAEEATSIGWWRLKGIDEPVELFALGEDTAPPPDAPKAWRVVREPTGGWRPAREVPHNLAGERDPFVGRAADLLALGRLLDRGARLATITGMGGTGKTRIARRFARERLGDRPGGAWWVDLADARDAGGIVAATARALGLRATGDGLADAVGRALAGRGSCLVVLDNFEQVVRHADETVGLWLDQAPDATFLVTSREPLQVPGEQVVPLGSLALDGEAQELFRLRARALDPTFSGEEEAVTRVVELLDGIPLAIELAAARVRVLGVAGVAERLRDRFALLVGRRGPDRQATLRAAIDWSWQLLQPWEQAALSSLSVFEAPFRLDAAEAVIDLSAWPEAPPALDVVQALVDKSLLRVGHTDPERRQVREPWFGVYISIREYAAEKLLREPSREQDTFERHLGWFAGHGTPAILDALDRGDAAMHRHLGDELPDVLAAWRRASGAADPRTVALCRLAFKLLEMRGPLDRAAELMEATLRVPGLAPAALVAVRAEGAGLLHTLGHLDEALSHLATALAEAESVAPEWAAVTRGIRGSTLAHVGRRAEAEADLRAALAGHERSGNRRLAAIARQGLATMTMDSGPSEAGREQLLQVLAEHVATGNRRSELVVRSNLASLEKNFGSLDDALGHAEAAIALARELGDRRRELIARMLHADATAEAGRHPDPVSEFASLREALRSFGERRAEGVAAIHLGSALWEAGRLEESLAALRDAAAVLAATGDTVHQAVAVANIGATLLDIDRAAEARPALEHAVALVAGGPPRIRGAAWGLLALALARTGDLDAAATGIRAAFVDLQPETLDWAKALVHRGQVEALAGDLAAARATWAEAEAARARLGAGADLERGLATLTQTISTAEARSG